MRKTKIVCTIGPASDSLEILENLIDAGMNVARLNFSHGTHEGHGRVIARVRGAAERKRAPIAILLDLSGPKIRIGQIKGEPILLKTGQRFILTSEKGASGPERVSVNYDTLPHEVHPGDQILLADGSVELVVDKVRNNDIVCEVVDGGELSSNKGINLPSCSLAVAALTEKDKADLEFGLGQEIDYIAMSFVRRRQDVEQLKAAIAAKEKCVPVIAKIEKHEALNNIDEIVQAADSLMVARGDLAVETPLEKVPLAQKMIINRCNRACKPVITATQMLKSMVTEPRPTRAEANDVANAVLDGTDAVMLSEETTIGTYPVLTVQTMVKIICATEASEAAAAERSRHPVDAPNSVAHAVSHAACQLALELDAAAILTPTRSGSTARMISSYRPRLPIFAFSPDPQVVRRLNLVWGVHPILAHKFLDTEDMIQQAKDRALQNELVTFGDTVVVTAGVPMGKPGTTNLIKTEVL